MKKTAVRTAVLALLLASACSAADTSKDNDDSKTAPIFEEARSSLARDTSVSLDAADAKTFRDGNLAFALKMHKALAAAKGNVALSPHSISTALAMAYAGARAETATEMQTALGYDLGPDKTHIGMNALGRELDARAGEGRSIDGVSPLRLAIDNATFAQKGAQFELAYLDVLAGQYGAGLKLADFETHANEERLRINDWVAVNTKDRIEELLPPNSIRSNTRLVLVNTIYMNAAWALPFDPNNTADRLFASEDGAQDTVKMMFHRTTMMTASTETADAVTLMYSGGKLSMTAILPKKGSLSDFEQSLDVKGLDAILAARKQALVALSMPQFTLAGESVSLASSLKAMGVNRAFTPGAADFSGISKSMRLHIEDVFHKAFIDVAEKGTEAAAATAVVFADGGIDPTPVTSIVLDRPFMVIIRDEPSGAILFTARVAKPTPIATPTTTATTTQ